MRRLGPPKTRRSPERSSRSVNGPVRRSTPASRNMQVSPRLIVTTGAADGSSPSWCSPSRAPRRVEVDDRRVGRVARRRRRRRTCRRPRRRASVDELGGQRLDRGAVGVVGRAACRRTAASASRGRPTARSSGGRTAPAGGGARPAATAHARNVRRRAAAGASASSHPAMCTTPGSTSRRRGSICAVEVEAELAADRRRRRQGAPWGRRRGGCVPSVRGRAGSIVVTPCQRRRDGVREVAVG